MQFLCFSQCVAVFKMIAEEADVEGAAGEVQEHVPFPAELVSTFSRDGYDYTVSNRSWVKKSQYTKAVGYYKCSHFRKANVLCKGNMHLHWQRHGDEIVTSFVAKTAHTCGNAAAPEVLLDFRHECGELAAELAIKHPDRSADAIAKFVIRKFTEDYQGDSFVPQQSVLCHLRVNCLTFAEQARQCSS